MNIYFVDQAQKHIWLMLHFIMLFELPNSGEDELFIIVDFIYETKILCNCTLKTPLFVEWSVLLKRNYFF